ncbi:MULTISPECIES: LON peptidase substrate-binding domain-containing protein [Pseudomonas]|jgi:Lon protease-like protein|uniref:LON peptidase substrate-binding domain-containing protein n=1 Tax=Pseudomonas psychrophila TaxID=122355 RepID=A0A8I1FPS8_9PSED|nr:MULTISPECIES: LON peptidase substrate-binding domain-containing protein [Pseudomonas]EPJ95124.1 peptidase S16, lon-like protein [Pseudomonas psychrophila]KAB0492909.1 ATP-dependent protease [Pseudomonas psychrophila]KMN03215.1 ATP-dependent protease [Pseudomonas psychrophila]MBJ2256062.1 LON peptidase substrate-binding domain-containing protein [Pseudomonas psychrophila]MDY7583503.1 LON peptidase substrate-binding domain-containing protein [Pseudomonas sp. CCI3.1]
MTLPLFPLKTVLFPGCVLDLQIFEARYLDMIARCMKQGTGFGVVCILDGREVGNAPQDIAGIGCEALIRDFQRQDNGLLGIRVEGGRRFEVLSTELQRDQLLVAQVEWLSEIPEQPLQDEDQDLLALLKALAEHPMVAALSMNTEVAGQQSLANQLAYLLPFAEADKIELLQVDDPQQRLDGIQVLLDEIQGEAFT